MDEPLDELNWSPDLEEALDSVVPVAAVWTDEDEAYEEYLAEELLLEEEVVTQGLRQYDEDDWERYCQLQAKAEKLQARKQQARESERRMARVVREVSLRVVRVRRVQRPACTRRERRPLVARRSRTASRGDPHDPDPPGVARLGGRFGVPGGRR